MPNFTSSVAAATAVVGYDLFGDQVWARVPQPRALNGFGLMGSAAALDTEVELYIDETRVGQFFNQGTGVPNNDSLMTLEGLYIPPGAQLRCVVTDAPTTNPINAMVAVQDI